MADKESLKKFDQRILKHQFMSGAITRKDYEAFLKSLPDSEGNADYIDPYEEMQELEESSGLTFTAVD